MLELAIDDPQSIYRDEENEGVLIKNDSVLKEVSIAPAWFLKESFSGEWESLKQKFAAHPRVLKNLTEAWDGLNLYAINHQANFPIRADFTGTSACHPSNTKAVILYTVDQQMIIRSSWNKLGRETQWRILVHELGRQIQLRFRAENDAMVADRILQDFVVQIFNRKNRNLETHEIFSVSLKREQEAEGIRQDTQNAFCEASHARVFIPASNDPFVYDEFVHGELEKACLGGVVHPDLIKSLREIRRSFFTLEGDQKLDRLSEAERAIAGGQLIESSLLINKLGTAQLRSSARQLESYQNAVVNSTSTLKDVPLKAALEVVADVKAGKKVRFRQKNGYQKLRSAIRDYVNAKYFEAHNLEFL